jgi:hypothetical protein
MNAIDDEPQWMVAEKLDQNQVFKDWNSTFNRYKFINSKPSGEKVITGNTSVIMKKRSTATKPKPKGQNILGDLEILLLSGCARYLTWIKSPWKKKNFG